MKFTEMQDHVEYGERYWHRLYERAFYLELIIRAVLTVAGVGSIVALASGSTSWGWATLAIISLIVSHVILPVFKLDGIANKISKVHQQWRSLNVDIIDAETLEEQTACGARFKELWGENHDLPPFRSISAQVYKEMEEFYG